jgi:hypothetical protein
MPWFQSFKPFQTLQPFKKTNETESFPSLRAFLYQLTKDLLTTKITKVTKTRQSGSHRSRKHISSFVVPSALLRACFVRFVVPFLFLVWLQLRRAVSAVNIVSERLERLERVQYA